MELYVTMQYGSQKAWAYYSMFRIGNKTSKYTLTIEGYMSQSTAGDSLSYHNGMKFSTPDQDNTPWARNCAREYYGAHWHRQCLASNFLGNYNKELFWESFKGVNSNLDKIKLQIRPKQYSISRLCITDIKNYTTCIDCNLKYQDQIQTISRMIGPSCQEYGINYFENKKVCSQYMKLQCHQNCQSCTGPHNYNCLECATGKIENFASQSKDPKHCLNTCPVGTFLSNGACLACHANCETCSGLYQSDCLTCATGKKKFIPDLSKSQKHCLDACPSGTFLNLQNECVKCNDNCNSCSGSQAFNCIECATGKIENFASQSKDPKHCVDACPIRTFNSEGICLACHPNCESCSGLYQSDCLACVAGKKKFIPDPSLSTKHCLDYCPSKTYQDINGSCLTCNQQSKDIQECTFILSKSSITIQFLMLVIIFIVSIPMIILFRWRIIFRQDIRKWSNRHSQSFYTQNINSFLQSIFYYYYYTLNLNRCNEFLLCIIACSDLTFTALNPDMYILRQVVSLFNLNRSIIFFITNLLLYNNYSRSINCLNFLTSAIFLPVPYLYKFLAPGIFSKKKIRSQGLQTLFKNQNDQSNYTGLNLNKKALRMSLSIAFGILAIFLLLWILFFDQPEIDWALYVIMIQYGSFLIFYFIWGLICFLIKRNNRNESITRLPDWRVEMVFNDLVIMKNSNIINSSFEDKALNQSLEQKK